MEAAACTPRPCCTMGYCAGGELGQTTADTLPCSTQPLSACAPDLEPSSPLGPPPLRQRDLSGQREAQTNVMFLDRNGVPSATIVVSPGPRAQQGLLPYRASARCGVANSVAARQARVRSGLRCCEKCCHAPSRCSRPGAASAPATSPTEPPSSRWSSRAASWRRSSRLGSSTGTAS